MATQADRCRAWREANPEKQAQASKRWRIANPERARENSLRTTKLHRERHGRKPRTPEQREARNVYERGRRRKDPRARLSVAVGNEIRRLIVRGTKRSRSWQALVGYSIDELRAHLERQFLVGMGWHNYGAWHVDHVQPVTSFKFTSPDDPEFRACWALSNLRPLWAVDNIRKRNTRTHLL